MGNKNAIYTVTTAIRSVYSTVVWYDWNDEYE